MSAKPGISLNVSVLSSNRKRHNSFRTSDVRREFAIWAKAVVQVLETLPDILERDCGLQPAAVSRVQSIIDDLRDQIALRVTEAGADDEEELQQEE